MLALMLVGVVDLVSWIRTWYRLERAVGETVNIVTQADRLREADFAGFFDITQTVANPTATSGPTGATVLSGISTSAGVTRVVWQRRTGDPTLVSGFGAEGAIATLPDGYTVPAGQTVVAGEAMTRASPWFLARGILGDGQGSTLRAFAIYRPRSAALSSVEP